MPTTIGQHAVATFTSPVNGTTPIDANTVRGNDNTMRTAYVAHDADPGIHVQSSTLASRPVAGTAGRKWITADAGSYKLFYDDGTRWHEVGGDTIDLEVIADATLVKGDVVMVTGFNNGQNVPTVNKYDGTAPAFGIASEGIASGSRGYVINTGIISDINTNSFGAIGTVLYPAATGTFTATKPTSGTYQVSAYVLRQNTNNGVLYVEFSASRIVERSDNTASTIVLRDASGDFSAGTITATAVNTTTLDLTNLEVTNIKAKDGTAAATIADSTGKITVSSELAVDNLNLSGNAITSTNTDGNIDLTPNGTGEVNITKVDIDSGTIDGTTIGGSSAAAGTFTTLGATTGNITTVNATTIDTTNIEVTNVKAKDGTASITIADSTGALTFASALADSNLATISTAGKVANSATTATATNTNSAIVARDASGNFAAGTITAALTGNASTATTLQTARNINGVSFNGSADITVTAAAGTLTGTTLAANVVSSSLTSVGTLTNLTVTNPISGSVTGNAGTATTLANTRTLWGQNFNGGANVTGSLTSVGDITGTAGVTLTATSGTLGLAATGANVITASTNGSERLRIDASGNLGLSTTSPSYLLSFGGNSARTVGMERHTTSNTAGNSLTVLAGGATSGATDKNGGTLALSSGTATGSGSSIITFSTATAGTAGTADRSPTEKMRLDASGNLGIGTTSPAYYMDIGSSSGTVDLANAALRIRRSGVANNWSRFDNVAGVLNINQYDATNPIIRFQTSTDGSTFTERMRLDASGNLGLGVTPSATYFQYRSIELFGSYWMGGNGTTPATYLYTNTYFDGADRYKTSGFAASIYRSLNGTHVWFTAPSGTAGNAITFTQAMTLDASGNLGIGTTTFGTSAAKVLALGNATEPSSGPADTVQIYSVDRSAGNTIPAIYCEGSGVTNAGITNTTVTHKIALKVNGTVYYLLATTNAT